MTRTTVKCFDGDGNPFAATVYLPMSKRGERIIRLAMTPPDVRAARDAEMRRAVAKLAKHRKEVGTEIAEEKAREQFLDLPDMKRVGLDIRGLREEWIKERQREIAAEMGVA